MEQIETFDDLKRWLDNQPDQMNGYACSVCQTGEPYIEFKEKSICRPGDEKEIEKVIAEQMYQRLEEYFCSRAGTIYWRIRFETDKSPHSTVIMFDNNGPDKEFISDRKCFLDKNWVRIAAYCRMYKARYKTMTPYEAALTKSISNLEPTANLLASSSTIASVDSDRPNVNFVDNMGNQNLGVPGNLTHAVAGRSMK